MIELIRDRMEFSFPDVHSHARLRIDFQRTLRIPDDDTDYPLPPGLGRFPLRHVDDFASGVPSQWLEHGGAMLPMYQSEALWLNFDSDYIADRDVPYPFAIRVAAGKIDAVTGELWRDGLLPEPQNYLVAPKQPWLDGYCVEKGVIRQFVAMPLGSGYTAEEQLTGTAEHGGVQIAVHPMRKEAFERRFPKRRRSLLYRRREQLVVCLASPAMGLAPGGRMKQEIYEDPYDFDDWELGQSSRCFVHIANSLVWRAITGKNPPTVPPTAKEYTQAGLPWFELYAQEANALGGASKLKELKSVVTLAAQKGDNPLPENEPVSPANIVRLRMGLSKNQVREGAV